jgi:hypothetical protein
MPTNDQVFLFDDGSGGANNVVGFCKAAFFPNVPISAIQVSTGAGNDRVEYDLTGDLTTARKVDVNLDAGADRFQAVMRRNLLAGSSLQVNVNGGGGNDRLQAVLIGSLAAGANLNIRFDGGGGNNILDVISATAVNVAAGANLSVFLNGNGFADRIFSDYVGVMNGSYSANIIGGRGPNSILQDIELAPGSTGTVQPSSVVGGPGPDQLTFLVHNPGTASSNNQTLDGGFGFDRCVRTTNVVVLNCEADTVVP